MLVGMENHRVNIPEAVPKASSEPLPEIAEFLMPFAPLFRRSQSRHSLERYITGLLTDLHRKNCDTIAAAVAGTSTERLQHLLTDADWDSLKLDGARVRSLSQKSPEGGILVLDDTSFPKQGKSSVGVARQYCGALGKRADCQGVVCAIWGGGGRLRLREIPHVPRGLRGSKASLRMRGGEHLRGAPARGGRSR